MEICRKKTDYKYYICLEENHNQITLITPSGQTKCLVRKAFDDPIEIDTSSESNFRVEIAHFALDKIQIVAYCNYLKDIVRSMIAREGSGPDDPENEKASYEVEEPSAEEWVIIYEKVIPIIKNFLYGQRKAALGGWRR